MCWLLLYLLDTVTCLIAVLRDKLSGLFLRDRLGSFSLFFRQSCNTQVAVVDNISSVLCDISLLGESCALCQFLADQIELYCFFFHIFTFLLISTNNDSACCVVNYYITSGGIYHSFQLTNGIKVNADICMSAATLE